LRYKSLNVAIIGCGTIGTAIAEAIDSGTIDADLRAVYDKIHEKAFILLKKMKNVKPKIAGSFDELLDQGANLIVEAASQEAVQQYGRKVLEKGIDLMIMSVGALLRRGLLDELVEVAEKSGARIYIPSGAIGGIDYLKAASLAGVYELVMVTRKPPASLKDAPGAAVSNLDNLREPTVLYEGDAIEAVKLFPANINASATISLITNKPVKVRIIADPQTSNIVHELIVRGAPGEIYVKVVNLPSPQNPKTSYIAALSAIQLLRQLSSPIWIGT